MRELPSGTVTFLLTDVEGSTRLLHELGAEAYADALGEHRRVIREVCVEHGGVEVDTQGDAFFFAFPTAPGALAAAGAMTEALATGAIQVRVGLHTGTPLVTDEGYVGDDVHLAARVAGSAHGGQVVLTHETAALVDLELTDLGEHRLKDIAGPVPILQLGGSSFPPLKTISNTNLPRPASSFIGREAELQEVLGRIERGARLVTLTGPGGSGKTRLALEAAATLVPEYKAGVFWIGLAALRDPALVTETIAQTLGAKDGLVEHVGERELLLLLDNLEQVIEAAPELSALVSACPNLALLVTSRELLRVQGEVEYPVPPLAEPEAVALFCERAQLEPSEEIAELCARLDNLPLAVELAAARTKALTPAQILERLSQRLDLLKGGRDADPRQQTLRATIEWSYDLLAPEEQRLFARLSVFAGGCTLEAADQVCDGDLDTVQSIVEKSLLRFADERYWMLETIRDFAVERVEASVQADDRRRHAEYFCRVSEAAEFELVGPRQDVWLAAIEVDLDNIRAALGWSLGLGGGVFAARMLGSLPRFWYVRGHSLEERRWLDRALSIAEATPVQIRPKLLRAAAANAQYLRDYDRSRDLTEQRLALARDSGDRAEQAACLNNLAVAAEGAGEYSEAEALLREAIVLFAEVGGRTDISLTNLSRVVAWQGDFEAAERFASEAVAIAREHGDLGQVLDTTQWMSWLCIRQDRLADALVLQREGLALAIRLQSKFHLRMCCENLAFIAGRQGQLEEAAQLLEKAQALRSEIGLPAWTPETDPLNAETELLLTRGLGEDARRRARERGRKADAHELLASILDTAHT